MADIAIRPRARTDLEEIWEYMAQTWGRPQVELYLGAMNKVFQELARNPRLGKTYDLIHKGLRAYPSGKHLVSYFERTAGIDVVRVLHERMDIASHVEDENL